MKNKTSIKNIRYKLGMTQKEFASFFKVSQSNISDYESGKITPSFRTIRKIVDKLKTKGINIEYKDLKE